MARLVQVDRRDREEQRSEERAERERAEREEQEIAAWYDEIEAVANGAMLAAAFHKHRGQWRKSGLDSLRAITGLWRSVEVDESIDDCISSFVMDATERRVGADPKHLVYRAIRKGVKR